MTRQRRLLLGSPRSFRPRRHDRKRPPGRLVWRPVSNERSTELSDEREVTPVVSLIVIAHREHEVGKEDSAVERSDELFDGHRGRPYVEPNVTVTPPEEQEIGDPGYGGKPLVRQGRHEWCAGGAGR